MKKIIIIAILSQLLVIGCGNKIKEGESLVEVKPNGDSLFATVDKDGVYNGPFTAHYHDGSFAKGYFKQGYRDSLYELYWPNGLLQMKTQYIHGFEEGYRYYFDLTDSTKNYELFIRHNEIKVDCERYFSKEKNRLEYKYYQYIDSTYSYIGNLIFVNDTFDFVTSTYYRVYPYNGNYFEEIKLPLNNKSKISIDFFKVYPESFVDISFEKIENPKTGNTFKYSFEKTNYRHMVRFDISVFPITKGWHFVTGTIKEFIKGKGNRITPVYFNYYVY